MKISRISRIILSAEKRVAEILDAMPSEQARRSAESINAICIALVKRRTPIMPTALVVSEEGKNKSPSFPSHQTIYNKYSKVLKVWRDTYHDIVNIDGEAPLSGDDIQRIDTTKMEVGTANIVDRLKAIVFEVNQRNNVLKQIIDNLTPARAGVSPIVLDHEEIIGKLGNWIRELADNKAFQLDEFALKVTRRTPPSTRIIDAELLDELIAFTTAFKTASEARRSIS